MQAKAREARNRGFAGSFSSIVHFSSQDSEWLHATVVNFIQFSPYSQVVRES
jgi:hypothetical protein